MLRIWASKSATAAKQYFREGLVREDYYHEGREVAGQWAGLGAKRLGLEGAVDQPAFFALLDNTHPGTGDRLTPRTKDNRRVGYDFSWSVPKSVSVVEAITQDDRIRETILRCVRETMADLERHTKTRVRLDGANYERVTGEMTYAMFLHETSRPAPGADAPDPQLHVHAYVCNHTWDDVEKRFKALDVARIKADAPYYQAVFLFRVAAELRAMGYEIERRRHGWEVADISRDVIESFSNRTKQIERYIEKKGLVYAPDKARAAERTRGTKDDTFTKAELIKRWYDRLDDAEKTAIWQSYRISLEAGSLPIEDRSVEAVDFAIEKSFQRASAVTENRLMAEAVDFAAGRADSIEGLWRELNRPDVVRREMDGEVWVTTTEIIEEELSLLRLARDGRGTLAPIMGENHVFKDTHLSEEQRNAVSLVLESQDRVCMIQGAPGAGKTRLTREAVRAIEDEGKPVVAVAPTGVSAREALRTEAEIQEADTLWQLLNRKEMQEKARNGVIWVDEAGMVGTKSMRQLMEVAKDVNARVVLAGDPMQCTSVERGDALRLLADSAGAAVARVQEIRRQRDPAYRDVAELLSRGELDTAWEKIEAMGAIVEADDEARYEMLAADHVESLKGKQDVLVVSPTHAEGEIVTHEIRHAMREAGLLEKSEVETLQLKPLQVEEAEKFDARLYEPGTVVQFSQNVPGFRRGERVEVTERTLDGNVFAGKGKAKRQLPLKSAKHFEVYECGSIPFAVGDVVRITRNGPTKDGKHRIENSSRYTIAKFTEDGDMVFKENKWVMPKDFGHVAYGHCVTCMNSQSKTTGKAIEAHSRLSLGAGSFNGFLVAMTRGTEAVRVYTDDKEALLDQVRQSAKRKGALELLGDSTPAADPKERRLQMGLMMNRLKAHQRKTTVRRRQELARMKMKRERDAVRNRLMRGRGFGR